MELKPEDAVSTIFSLFEEELWGFCPEELAVARRKQPRERGRVALLEKGLQHLLRRLRDRNEEGVLPGGVLPSFCEACFPPSGYCCRCEELNELLYDEMIAAYPRIFPEFCS